MFGLERCSYEFGCPSKREDSHQLLAVPRENRTPYELDVSSKRMSPIKYSMQQALSVTPTVVQASGRLMSTIWNTKNLIPIMRLEFGVISKVDRLG